MPEAKAATISPGLVVGQVVRPLDVVAAYIPAGRYPLPSTLMMTVIPAQVAGVPSVCVTSPRRVAEILGTASLLGVQMCSSSGALTQSRPSHTGQKPYHARTASSALETSMSLRQRSCSRVKWA